MIFDMNHTNLKEH